MILVRATSEFGERQTVLMRHVGPVTLDLSCSQELDPVHRCQLETSNWAPYSVEVIRAQQQSFVDLLRS